MPDKDYSALISKLEQERVTRILFFPNNKIFKKINKCHIRNDEIHILCASLYSLLNANNPLLLSLKICTQNQKNPKLKSSLYRVSEQISLGKQLSKVLRQEIKELDNYSIQLIKVDEQSGLLPQALNSISRYYKKNSKK